MCKYRPLFLTGVALGSLFLVSCVESKNPVSDLDKSLPEKRFYGVWIEEKEGQRMVWAIGSIDNVRMSRKDIPQGIMRAAVVDFDTNGSVGKPFSVLFFVSPFDASGGYINWFEEDVLDESKFKTWDKANIKSYLVVKYVIRDDRIELYTLDTDAIEAAVKKGQIKGTIEHDPKKGTIDIEPKTVQLSASSGELDQFLRKEGASVISKDKPRVLKKLADLK
jgi:hypothetical protein